MSRLIVKNLPLKITEEKLRNTFSSKGNVTDLQLKYNKDGKFRGFAFLGFKSEEEADVARKYFDGTYLGAAKIDVQKCLDLGDSVPANNKEQKKVEPLPGKNNKLKAKKEAASILDKYKEDEKFQEFLRMHKRNAESWTNESVVEVANLYKEEHNDKQVQKDDKENNDVNHNETAKKKTKNFETLFHVKLSNLPYNFKKKMLKTFLSPLRPHSIRLPPNTPGIAYAGFRTDKEQKQALNKNRSLWEGRQIVVAKHVQKVDPESGVQASSQGNSKWKEQEEGVKQTETVGDSGRIFLRNLSYTVTEDDIREVFEEFGPLSEVNLPIDKMTRKSKGFAFVTFMMPEHAVQAFSQLDGSTLQGRLLHLIPAKTRDDENGTELEGSNFKKSKTLKDKKQAGMSHNWNSLFLGASAVADLMSEKYNVAKADIVM
jgi:multiple RNA-binding domain-containing protein 1